MSDGDHYRNAERGGRSSGDSLDAVEVVRQHPEWYFRSGRFDLNELISHLVEEASRGGATSVQVLRDGQWVSIAADRDWLNGDVGAFFAPVSYPEGGRNSSRVEVVLTAFCDFIATSSDDLPMQEVKSPPDLSPHVPPHLLPQGSKRTIVFMADLDVVAESEDTSSIDISPRPLRLIHGEGENRLVSAVESFIRKAHHA